MSTIEDQITALATCPKDGTHLKPYVINKEVATLKAHSWSLFCPLCGYHDGRTWENLKETLATLQE